MGKENNRLDDVKGVDRPPREPDNLSEETIQDTEKELQVRLERTEIQAKENYDRLLRVSADFENYKKRMNRESESFKKYANESLIRELLPVVDNLERAFDSASLNQEASQSLVKGVHLTISEIQNIFKRFSVKPISSVNKPFDPAFHQAVIQEETDAVDENMVIKELQKGYLIHDRLLRPAMVVVSKSPANQNKDNE
ncbi:MAG: nucleotide exchange factor GrpE [Deltaproteobacteria bacterium RBG_13_49_15]|nr:MAG: nucleotide exchange factor GrpE [Deltaproteobacteria bacterium RBG_13_49_15]